MIITINWDNAPEGTTHFDPDAFPEVDMRMRSVDGECVWKDWLGEEFGWSSEYNQDPVFTEGYLMRPCSEPVPGNEGTLTGHYDSFLYDITPEDIDQGYIRVDPYFVSQQWELGKRDDTGCLFHNLKTLARFGDKNEIEREIRALHAQTLRLAELNGVDLKEEY